MPDLDVGDIVWAELDPVLGTEQAKRRPALVITSAEYHQRSPRAVICPISNASASWSFNLPVPAGLKTKGVVQTDQVRTVDRAERLFRMVERVPPDFMVIVQIRLAGLLNINSVFDPNAANAANSDP